MVEQLFEFLVKRRVWPVCVCERQNSSCVDHSRKRLLPDPMDAIRSKGQVQLMGVKGSWELVLRELAATFGELFLTLFASGSYIHQPPCAG